MTQAEDFFDPWQKMITDWTSALDQINQINKRATASRTMVWRGMVDAAHSLHSSLFRRLDSLPGVPTELDMVAFELRLLEQSRTSWRFDNLSALETLANIQHLGGPTRLLDVSFNPLVALWFAVELQYDKSGNKLDPQDGRIFAFDVTNRQIALNEKWGSRDLPWAKSATKKWGHDEIPWKTAREKRMQWHRSLPYVWRPPSFNERIPAQNAGFLVGGLPSMGAGDNLKYYRKNPGDGRNAETWSMEEVIESTSVTTRLSSLGRRLHSSSTPTFTLRIASDAKKEIRDILETRFGLNASTIYPDLYGLAKHGANRI